MILDLRDQNRREKATSSGRSWTWGVNSLFAPGPQNKRQFLDSGFAGNATVYSIIRMISDRFATIPCYLYEVKDSKHYKRYKSLSRDISNTSLLEYEKAKKKALREIDNHDFLTAFEKLGFEGRAQMCGIRDISGDCIMWKNRGLFEKQPPIEYRLLPSHNMDIKMGANPWVAQSYVLNMGKIQEFPLSEIAHWKYWNPYFDPQGSHLYGLAPLKAGFIDLLTNTQGKQAAYSDFKNNGIKGLITRKEDRPWDTQTRDDVQSWVDDNMNGSENRGKIRAINMNASWLQTGLSATEMELMKALQLTKEDLCNVFQFPPRLLASVEGTFNNVESSGKQLITQCIYPRIVSYSEFVDTQLLPDFEKEGRLHYSCDITSLPEMQGDMKELVQTLKDMPISSNEFREMTNWDKSTEANADRIVVNSNRVFLDEMSTNTGDQLGSDITDLEEEGLNDYSK